MLLGNVSSFQANTNNSGGSNNSSTDTVNSVIMITGGNTLTLAIGATFNVPVTSVTDNKDTGFVIKVDSNNVDTVVAGTYTVVYFAKDRSGNKGTATLTITVNTDPVIPPA